MGHEYFREHLSLSQWAIETQLQNRKDLLDEEASKGQRLELLSKTIGLPIVETECFKYEEIRRPSGSLLSLLAQAGQSLYAVTAYPKRVGQPLQRNRKQTLANLIEWILSLEIDFEAYDYCFEPHVEAEISLILAVNAQRIIGEASVGSMLQLSKGKPDGPNPIYFEYNRREWSFSERAEPIEEFLETALARISVTDPLLRSKLSQQLDEFFTDNYLRGYFEVIGNKESGLIFIEYNRLLKDNLEMVVFSPDLHLEGADVLHARGASSGKTTGKARVVNENQVAAAEFRPGEIMVCRFISPRCAQWIRSAAAVVADLGGILSHPAIICRELGKPCVVATKNGTDSIRTGDALEIDGAKGIVRILH